VLHLFIASLEGERLPLSLGSTAQYRLDKENDAWEALDGLGSRVVGRLGEQDDDLGKGVALPRFGSIRRSGHSLGDGSASRSCSRIGWLVMVCLPAHELRNEILASLHLW